MGLERASRIDESIMGDGVAGAGRACELHVMKQGCFNVINVIRQRRCRRRYLEIISRPSAKGSTT